ncbi:hypothetical protein [Stecheria intestinalis]|jgi:hypothetical protein|nr:hypothetical protein [Stecheria intestinalis]MCI2155015.1 hypothetical protein [Solobacterium sp.]MCI6744887.1 hypothetical protein [Anaerolactibacter massiliensis]
MSTLVLVEAVTSLGPLRDGVIDFELEEPARSKGDGHIQEVKRTVT